MKSYKPATSTSVIKTALTRIISVALIVVALIGLNISANTIVYSNNINQIIFHLMWFICCLMILFESFSDIADGHWPLEKAIKGES